MLKRSVQRSLQFQWPPVTHPSHVCACQCGRQLSTPPKDTLHRTYATYKHRRAPTTRDKDWKLKRRALTPEESREEQEFDYKREEIYRSFFQDMYRGQSISVPPDAALEFLSDFDSLLQQVKGRPTADPDNFLQLVQQHGLTLEDCRFLSRTLLTLREHWPDRAILGKRLLLTCSRAGYEEATISVMGHAVLQHIQKPGALRASEIKHASEHLDRIAASDHNYRANVLKGRVAEVLGDEITAIRMWTSAMASAVEAAAKAEADKRSGIRPEFTGDQFELTTPWIDLFHIHRRRGEARQANWALEIGCQQDDPDAHYLYADYSCLRYHDYEQTQPIYTSEWLYHMIKAATSGHNKAAFQLGEFYAQSSWKYIEDEPPDEVKPTPFDSYPASTVKRGTWLETVQAFLGSKQLEPTKRDDIFHIAAFPHDAVDRFRIALDWANVAIRHCYAPASLLRAKIHYLETIDSPKSSPRTAPKDALELKDSRYTYASKADYEAGIKKNPEVEDDRDGDELIKIPNPFYNIPLAKHYLREVFYAYQAHGLIAGAKKQYLKDRRLGLVGVVANDDDIIQEKKFADKPHHIRKWFRFQEVREQYEDNIEDLYKEAKDTCDYFEWDLYDDDGGLVYRAQTASGQGHAAAAAG